VIRKGETGKCMYILYYGKVGIYTDEKCTKQVVALRPNEVIGETALERDVTRTASAKALQLTKVLILHKQDYK